MHKTAAAMINAMRTQSNAVPLPIGVRFGACQCQSECGCERASQVRECTRSIAVSCHCTSICIAALSACNLAPFPTRRYKKHALRPAVVCFQFHATEKMHTFQHCFPCEQRVFFFSLLLLSPLKEVDVAWRAKICRPSVCHRACCWSRAGAAGMGAHRGAMRRPGAGAGGREQRVGCHICFFHSFIASVRRAFFNLSARIDTPKERRPPGPHRKVLC